MILVLRVLVFEGTEKIICSVIKFLVADCVRSGVVYLKIGAWRGYLDTKGEGLGLDVIISLDV